MLSLVVSLAFVNRSDSGLPLASVSNGMEGGMFVPRMRTYCEDWTAGRRWVVITRKVVPSMNDGTAVQAEAPLPLNVRMSAVEVFFAAFGTPFRFGGVAPFVDSQLVLRGHSPE